MVNVTIIHLLDPDLSPDLNDEDPQQNYAAKSSLCMI